MVNCFILFVGIFMNNDSNSMNNSRGITIHCAIYIRTDVDDPHFDRVSGENQKRQCQKLIAERADWGCTKIYEDDGCNGENMDRPGFQELLADVQAGKIDKIVVHDFGRLTQSPIDYFYITTLLQQHDIHLILAAQPINSLTSGDNFVMSTKMPLDEYERIMQEREQAQQSNADDKGKSTGGDDDIPHRAIYVRGDDVFRGVQEFQCRKFLKENPNNDNHKITIYEDCNDSNEGIDRPGFPIIGLQKLLDDLRDEQIVGVIVYDVTRLAQSLNDWTHILSCIPCGSWLHIINTPCMPKNDLVIEWIIEDN
jgi:DNA invertase Pin-like site-specific DNA recombinase